MKIEVLRRTTRAKVSDLKAGDVYRRTPTAESAVYYMYLGSAENEHADTHYKALSLETGLTTTVDSSGHVFPVQSKIVIEEEG